MRFRKYRYFAYSEIVMSRIFPVILAFVIFSCSAGPERSGDNGNSKNTDGNPGITFTKTAHNFGKVIQGETVGFNYTFENTGSAGLLIIEAKASCGCTVPRYSKEPIPPGGKGSIEVVFDSSGRMGNQKKTVTVKTNADSQPVYLVLMAEIITNDESQTSS